MSKRLAFLLGILLGELLMVPKIYSLWKTPRIEGLVVSDAYVKSLGIRVYGIKGIKSHSPLAKNSNILWIHIASEDTVNSIMRNGRPGPNTILGFYSPVTHEIWCVDSTDVVIHEIRHATEGAYHR